METDFWKDPN